MTRDTLAVTKMSGAGNDFLVLGPEAAAALGSGVAAWVRRVCVRGLSVGADGVLLVEPAGPDRVHVRFYNPDGSEAFCGNGSRCAARYASLRAMTGNRPVLETSAGDVPAEVAGETVRLRLPPPHVAGAVVVDVGDAALEGLQVVPGTPHFVAFVDDPAAAPLDRWGPIVCRDPRFAPSGINLDLARSSGGRVVLRTWEKGVERETLACGSGAVAAAVAARVRGAGDTITVVPRSGVPLQVEFPNDGGVMLEGDARIVFEGRLGPEATRWSPASRD